MLNLAWARAADFSELQIFSISRQPECVGVGLKAPLRFLKYLIIKDISKSVERNLNCILRLSNLVCVLAVRGPEAYS
jgi:hypothetical protein